MSGVLTLAMMAHGVSCARPWDTTPGSESDVLRDGHLTFKAVEAGRLKHVHFATPHMTMTWDRVPQLRFVDWPLGRQDVSYKQRDWLQKGKGLASFTMSLCIFPWSKGATFSVENLGCGCFLASGHFETCLVYTLYGSGSRITWSPLESPSSFT